MKIIKNIPAAFFAVAMAFGVSANLSAQSREFKQGRCMLYTETPDTAGAVTARSIVAIEGGDVDNPVNKSNPGKWRLSGNDFSLEVDGLKIHANSTGTPLSYKGTYITPQGESNPCEALMVPYSMWGIFSEKLKNNLIAGQYTKAYVHFWYADDLFMPQKAYPVEVKFNPVEGFNGGSIEISGSPELMSLLSSPTIPYYFDGKMLKVVRPNGRIVEDNLDEGFAQVWVRFDDTIQLPGIGEALAYLAIYY